MSENAKATGGTITEATIGGKTYVIHTFTASGTFEPDEAIDVEYIIVAGGAGGGSRLRAGGGGGAGGLLTNFEGTLLSLSATPYTIVVGSGGAGGADDSSYPGGDGGNSSAFGLTAIGGGGGGCTIVGVLIAGRSGGSGGGGAASSFGNGSGGSGTSGQGHAGGTAFHTDNSNRWGGGGGGSTAVGGNASSGNRGLGGAGLTLNFRGTSETFAAGGNGGNNTSGTTQNGAANTGNGGEGVTAAVGAGGNGGSGIVIIRYEVEEGGATGSGVEVDAETAELVIEGKPAGIATGVTVDAAPGSLIATPLAADIQTGVTVDTEAGALEVTGQAADIQAGTEIDATLGELVMQGQPAEILQATDVIAALAELRITPRQASIQTTGGVDVQLGALTIDALAADVQQATDVAVQAGALILSAVPAAVEQAYTVSTQTAAITLDALVAELRQAGVVTPRQASVRVGDVLVTEVYQLSVGGTKRTAMSARGDPAILLHIEGEGFQTGASVSLGPDITVTDVTVDSETLITATIAVGANAAIGFRTVTVTNTDDSEGELANQFRVFRGSFAPVTGADELDPSPWDSSYWHGDSNDFPAGGLQWETLTAAGDPASGFIPGDLPAIGYDSFPDVGIPQGATITAAFLRTTGIEHNCRVEAVDDGPFLLRYAFQLEGDPPVPEDGAFTVGDPEVRINFPNTWTTTTAEALVPIPFSSVAIPGSGFQYHLPPVDLTESLQEVVSLSDFAGERVNLQMAFMPTDEDKIWYAVVGAFPSDPTRTRLFVDWTVEGEGETLTTSLVALIATGQPVSIEARVDINTQTSQLVMTAGHVQVVLGTSIQAKAGLLQMAGQVADIVSQSAITTELGQLVITPHKADPKLGDIIRVEVARLEMTAEPAEVLAPITIDTEAGVLAIAGVRATIISGDLEVSVRPVLVPEQKATFTVEARQDVFVIPPAKGNNPIH